MVSQEEKTEVKDALKRKAETEDEEGKAELNTSAGKIARMGVPERKYSSTSFYQNFSQGDRVGLECLDAIPGSIRNRNRTSSMHLRMADSSGTEKNRSLPSTPASRETSRKRHFSQSDVSRNLLGSFTESALNLRLDPVKILDGFTIQLAASGPKFSSEHSTLPVTVCFFELNTTGCEHFPAAPVPYLGKCELTDYRIPPKGTLQVTLFNPQETVIKMFLTNYDVQDMPPNSKTFIRHVWQWKVESEKIEDGSKLTGRSLPKNLQHLIHYRLCSDKKSRIFLHTDIRILFAQDAARDALLLPQMNSKSTYRLTDHLEMPANPRYSSSK